MRFFQILVVLLCALSPGFSADASTSSDEPPAVRRARMELSWVQDLVSSGVLPRARLEQAQDALADAQDDSIIRGSLYEKDVSVAQADLLVEVTARRMARSQKAFDERNKLLSDGIIARSELTDAQASLDQAKREHSWAATRAQLARELAELARNELEIMRRMELSASTHASFGMVEHFVGGNRFDMAQFPGIEKAFEKRFAHTLPVSAMGQTEVHKALGFDHRNRIDVALQPDQPEGKWLCDYLVSHKIPYFAFRAAVAHKATGAHIHIGPPSLRYLAQAHTQPHAIVGED